MEAPKEVYLEICYNQELGEEYVENVWRDSPIPEDGTIKYLRSDLAVDREKLVEWLNRSKFLFKEEQKEYNGWGVRACLAFIESIEEKLKEL